jgi:hypothetical protein
VATLAAGGFESRVNVRCLFEDPDVTLAERDVVDAWLVATDCSGVTEVTIEDLAVLVQGNRQYCGTVIGTALRHGDLPAELMAALVSMRS